MSACGATAEEWGVACELRPEHDSAHYGSGVKWSGYWGRGVLHMDRVPATS